MGFHDLFGDGQTKAGVAGAGAPGGIQPEEPLEHPPQLLRRDGGPGILEGEYLSLIHIYPSCLPHCKFRR